jgi:hypothetical protein
MPIRWRNTLDDLAIMAIFPASVASNTVLGQAINVDGG